MPRSSKKRKPNQEPDPPSSSSSASDDDDDQEQVQSQENIQVDLEARSPIDTDHATVLYFLEQSFGGGIKKSVLDLHQLATQLVTQQSCGSVFYQPLDSTEDENDDDDDDDESPVLGICSFLRFDQQVNKQLYQWLLEKCAENSQAKTILQSSKCGFFVNERYMNIPAEISVPAIRTLREEIPYQIDYWIIHAKIRIYKNDSNSVYYLNGEEEIFEGHSTCSIDYHPVQANVNDWVEKRKIMLVPTNKLDRIVSDIEQKLKQEK